MLRVLAGEIDGHMGPGISHTPLSIAHLTLAPGAQIDIPWNPSFNSIVYALAGSGSVGVEQRPLSAGQTALMQYGSALRITAAARQESRSPNFELFIIGGEPLREPVVAYGPFVMSTQAEIVEAFEDYQAGRLGVIPADAIQPHRI